MDREEELRLVAVSKRLTRDRWGNPVLVIRVEGTHDIYRLARHLERGQVEFYKLAGRILRSLRRQLGAKAYRVLVSYYDGSLWKRSA